MTGRAWTLTAAAVVITLGGTMVVAVSRRHDPPVRTTALGRLVAKEVTAPPNARVRVEIINATRTRGLARRATRLLRDHGFDVVTYTTSSRTQDTTVVLDRSNHLEWARLVGQALGGARVEARPHASSYVDVTVLLGSSWRAPSQPFSP